MAGRDQVGAEGLKVAIGLPSAVMLVVGGIVGVGVFVNPAIVARSLHSPWLVEAAWGAGGIIAILGAIVYAELAARIPATGGDYAYLRETYGPLAAFLVGWTLLLVVQTGGMAAVSIVFSKNLNVLSGGALDERWIIVILLSVLAGVNVVGVSAGNGVQTILGAIKIAMIAALILAGLLLVPAAHVASDVASAQAETPTGAMASLKAFGAAMIPVVFSYGGWQTANFVAGEMKDARRNMARALVTGVLIVIALYMLVTLACVRALGVGTLSHTLTPASDVLGLAIGPAGAMVAAAAVGVSALGYLSQSMLTAPRVYFAMARDGLFFRGVGEVSARTRAPALAILLQAIWTGVLALSGKYEQILSYVIAMNFLFFGLSASAIFVLRARERRSGIAAPAGFRAPGHPWTTGAFIVACILVICATFWSYPVDSLIGYGLMGLGIPPYLYWRRAGRRAAGARLRE
jgi:APA family basic amino acid/polyamine antiporter